MSSLITSALWETVFPNRPMPGGMTLEAFHAAQDVVWRNQDLKQAMDYMAELDKVIAVAQPAARVWAQAEKEKVLEYLGS